jgi:hypothetical protein
MLLLFHMDVANVDQGCCTYCICCKCFRDMLQEFVQNVSFVPDVCSKRFDIEVAYVSHICYNSMFQMFLFKSFVATSFHVESCKCSIWIFIAYVFTHMVFSNSLAPL